MSRASTSPATVDRLLAFIVICTAFTTGCVVGPDYAPPQTIVHDAWHQELVGGEHIAAEDLDQWWLMFEDPVLNELVARASQQNLDLFAAYARIQQARARTCIAAADRKPQINGQASFANSQQSINGLGFGGGAGGIGFLFGSQDLWTYGLDLSWEIDVFGRVQRSIESANASAESFVEAYRDLLVTYYADIARNYVQVRTLQQQLQYAHQNVEIQRRALDLAQRRVQGGISTNLDQYQAESNLATTESQIPQLEVQLHQTLNRLAVLTGSFPGTLHEALAHPVPIPTIPASLPQDVPCDVVRQRPDIRQAERAIAAATADVGVATGDLYPRFSLGRSLGWSSQKFSNLFFDTDSFQFSLGPAISWALFQSGRIRCNINSTEWAVSEALATYEQTLLRAFEEVENARVAFTKERERYHHLQVTVDAAEKSLQSVLALYKNGNTDFQNVLDTQRTLFEAQNALAISEGQIVTQLINIYRALGGGWDPNHHCPGRCIRLGFHGRVDAKIVEAIPVDDQSSAYYGAPVEQPVQPTSPPASTPTPTPPMRPDPLPPTNFRQELEKLRETIEGSVPAPGVSNYSPGPGISSYSPVPPNANH